MASEVVSIVLETIRNLLIEEAKFLSRVSDQVKDVQAELIRMQCFLKDADKKQQNEEMVRNSVKEIRQLAYRIENVLETYAIEVQSGREGRQGHGFRKVLERFACIFCEGKALHKIGSEIANIRGNIDSLTRSLQAYGVRGITYEAGQSSNAITLDQNQRLRQTFPHQVEEFFVGMKDDISQLLSLTIDEGIRSHRVICIYGMGGLGKTTIARKIYHHSKVQCCFQSFAWVSISQQFERRTVLVEVLKQLLLDQRRESASRMDEKELVGELYKVQKEKKCLVVLDDLWQIEDWKCLSPAFPFAERNSKILITTRNQKLAEAEFPYQLNFLTEDEGWELLLKKAFARREDKDLESDPKLEDVGRKIVRKCGKLPLAISALGGVLSQTNSLYEWESVNRDVDSYLMRIESNKEGYGIVSQVLALSYNELPYHLKPCFLYLGHFEEDEDIDVEYLYLMWIAEGMVLSDHRGKNETLMDVAEHYLSEMASRSMVQVELNEFPTRIRFATCRLHDLMRDFCLAKGKEVEFLKVLDFREGRKPLSDCYPTNNPCRLVILMDHTSRFPLQNDDAMTMKKSSVLAAEVSEQLRSLQFPSMSRWGGSYPSFPLEMCDFEKFKLLKVVNIEGYEFKNNILPEGITKLTRLRFLGLKNCWLSAFPSSLGLLQYLQILDLRTHGYDVEVPNVLWKLKRLRYLYLPSDYVTSDGKLRLHGLTQLATLVGFSSETSELMDVLELTSLRHLYVKVFDNKSLCEILKFVDRQKLWDTELLVNYYHVRELAVEENLVPLQDVFACLNVRCLTIISGKYEFQRLDDLQSAIPSNLIELELSGDHIEGDPIKILGKLCNLQKFTLQGGYMEKQMICDAKSFPKLKYLKISHLLNLEEWVIAEGAMPNLSHLVIWYCMKLKMIPDGLRFITGLKCLDMRMLLRIIGRVRLKDCEGEDYDKIRHIPSIYFFNRD